jgi:superfamily II DNA/RNA helicase
MMTLGFCEFDLQPQLVQTIADIGYAAQTPIQSTVIPATLAGQDEIGQLQTGPDKTAAFSCLFSATLPQHTLWLAKRQMNAPQSFRIGCKQLTVETVQ